MEKSFWSACKKIFWRKSVISVFLIVALWNLFVLSDSIATFLHGQGLWKETANDIREVNNHLQIRLYQRLSSLRPVPLEPKRVSLVFIDDVAHWTTFYGDLPTNRSFLAQLIKNASQPNTKAAAIGLDVELDAPLGYPPGMDEPDPKRGVQNQELLDAIFWAADHGVPVILASGYVHKDGLKTRLPSIYKDAQLPLYGSDGSCPHAACARLGFINAPDDKRQIPLVDEIYNWKGADPAQLKSFALAIVEASEGLLQTTNKKPSIVNAISAKRSLYGAFMTENMFPQIDVDELYHGLPEAEAKCANRIVMIGGHWHDLHSYGQLIDGHLSPAGVISGLTFHANYVESLLNDWFTQEVPVWIAILIDAIVGFIIYGILGTLKGWGKFLGLILAAFLPAVGAYVALVNFNKYLDFLLPLELYFVHLFYEFCHDYFVSKHSHV